MIHTRTKIIAGIAFGLFFTALALYVGISLLVYNHKNTLYDERYRAAEAEVQARALSALEATVASSKDDREKLTGYILKEGEIIGLLSLIERTAKEQGVTFETTLEEESIDDVFEEVVMNAVVDGSFDGVMRMLRIIETLPEQSRIPSVTLSKGGQVGGETWNARIELRVTKYIQP